MNQPALPDYLKSRPYESVSDQLGDSLGAGAPPYVSIAGGRFTLIDIAGNEQPVTTAENGVSYLDCVIVDSLQRISKIYYDHVYDPSSASPPTCFSDNGAAPSRNASSPQSPTCASCEKGAWGSAVSKVDPSKKVKACQDYQKLALIVLGFGGVYLLRVPPNSLRPLREYTARFKGSGTDVSDVITRISFERDVLGTLTFRGVSYIDQAVAQLRNDARAKKATDTMVGRLDQPITAALAGPQERPFVSSLPLAGSAPNAGFQPTPMVSPMIQPVTAIPASAPSNGRRRGRPRAPESQGQPQVASQAPFPTQSNPAANAAAGGPSFGIGGGSAPGADLSAALDNFFGPAPQK